MHTTFLKEIKDLKFTCPVKKYLPVLFLILVTSCAKEIYTSEDAADSKRESQKVGLTVMVRDINRPVPDLSGFTVSTTQYGETASGVTSADGTASLRIIRGDAVLSVQKDGYIPATAVVTTGISGNTVVIIPVMSGGQNTGIINGTVSVKTDLSGGEPLFNALVSIEMNMDELLSMAFPGMNSELSRYRPSALSYSWRDMLQPVRTGLSGGFSFTIPATPDNLTYTVNVHETMLAQNIFCSANVAVVTNGQHSSTVSLQLTPYGK